MNNTGTISKTLWNIHETSTTEGVWVISTFWRRNYFFLILAHSVYKMWIIQEPSARHFGTSTKPPQPKECGSYQPFGAGIIFFLILAYSVYKMWIIQEPSAKDTLEHPRNLHSWRSVGHINLLAPELFFFKFLAHPVYKMWIIQEQNS